MLRFNHQSDDSAAKSRRRKATFGRQRRQIWMLLGSLGLVLLAMRHLNQPETAIRIGQLFGAAELSSSESFDGDDGLAPDQQEAGSVDILRVPLESSTAEESPREIPSTVASDEISDELAAIRDNTYFRPAESGAWFGLLASLQQATSAQLREESLGELSYAQLLKQPDFYRGKAVTIRGVVRREELQQAPENTLGIKQYHRLWIEPKGGANWPIVVYCLNLSDDFPRGDRIDARINVTGYFFKNWSYPWRDGLGIAPVVLSRNVSWKVTPSAKASDRAGRQSVTQTALIACAFATLVVYIVVRSTQRAPRMTASDGITNHPRDAGNQAIRDQLQTLADAESSQ